MAANQLLLGALPLLLCQPLCCCSALPACPTPIPARQVVNRTGSPCAHSLEWSPSTASLKLSSYATQCGQPNFTAAPTMWCLYARRSSHLAGYFLQATNINMTWHVVKSVTSILALTITVEPWLSTSAIFPLTLTSGNPLRSTYFQLWILSEVRLETPAPETHAAPPCFLASPCCPP